MNLRKLIREVLEKNFNKQESEKNFIQDIAYLKDFELNKKEEIGHSTLWVFQNKVKDYTLRFYVQKNNYFGTWFAKLYIYWKKPTRSYTNAKGKDFDYKFGPYNSYKEMVDHLNNRLKNNPLISTGNYIDDNNAQFLREVIEMMKQLRQKSEKLASVEDSHFDDLKKLAKEISQIKTEEELEKYIEKKAPAEEDKQTLLLTLQKIHQIPFYKQKEHIDSLF